MLLRLLAYVALGIDCIIKHQYILAALCFITPFIGPLGMWSAAAAGIFFFMMGVYIEGFVALGVLIFNLVGN